MSVRVLVFGGLVVLAVPAIAADEPPARGPEVSVEPVDGETVTGFLRTDPVRLETTYGVQEVRREHVRRITFKPPGSERGQDVIEFSDKEHVQGRLLTDRFEIERDGRIQAFTASGLREIKRTAKPPAGTWALVIGLVTLSAMEIVLGIDNIIFLAIVAGKLPEAQQPRARRLGLIAALGTRILLLMSLSFLLGLTRPVFTIPEIPYLHDIEAREISLRDLILMAGGLFLIGKSVREIHEKLEAAREDGGPPVPGRAASFGGVLIQIAILDIVFSLDSVITAIGMVDVVWVMVVAMVIAMLVMMVFAGGISNFVARHPTIKVLALAFLILIGVMLVAESLGQHIDKGYIYFAMAFAVVIEMVNLRMRKRPVTETVTI
jgi:predicted tellurium resistance membrane protein TerC